MQGLGILLCVLLMGAGVIIIVAGDWMWRWTEWVNRSRGITRSERTKQWDNRRILSGIFTIVVGGLILYIFLSIP